MIIVYDSKTGNVERFIKKLSSDIRTVKITEGLRVTEPFILITYTTGFGATPSSTEEFLVNNNSQLKGVCASGNRNWGSKFGKSADNISQTYKIPIVHKFELSGLPTDVEKIIQEVRMYEQQVSNA